jgi:hypothetical protein
MLYRSSAAVSNALTAASGLITMTTEEGHLNAVSLHQTIIPPATVFFRAASIFGQVWLSNLETPLESPLFLLCQGYFGNDHSIGWSGSIKLGPSDLVIARFVSAHIIAVVLSLAVER